MRAGGGQGGVLWSRAGDPDNSVGLSVLPAPRRGRNLEGCSQNEDLEDWYLGPGIYVSDS